MAKYSIDGSTLTSIANSIRGKYGETDKIAVTDFAEAIENIPSGGGVVLPFDCEITETVLLTNQDDLTIENPRGVQAYGAILLCPEVLKNYVTNTIVLANIAFRSYQEGDDCQSAIMISAQPKLDSNSYSNNSLLNEEVALFTKRNMYQDPIKYRAGYKYYCIFLY